MTCLHPVMNEHPLCTRAKHWFPSTPDTSLHVAHWKMHFPSRESSGVSPIYHKTGETQLCSAWARKEKLQCLQFAVFCAGERPLARGAAAESGGDRNAEDGAADVGDREGSAVPGGREAHGCSEASPKASRLGMVRKQSWGWELGLVVFSKLRTCPSPLWNRKSFTAGQNCTCVCPGNCLVVAESF